MLPGGKVKVLRHNVLLLVNSQTCQPPDHDDCPKSEDQLYSLSSTGGGGGEIFLLPIGQIVCKNSPTVCRPSPGGWYWCIVNKKLA